jgi:hypothetical protein
MIFSVKKDKVFDTDHYLHYHSKEYSIWKYSLVILDFNSPLPNSSEKKNSLKSKYLRYEWILPFKNIVALAQLSVQDMCSERFYIGRSVVLPSFRRSFISYPGVKIQGIYMDKSWDQETQCMEEGISAKEVNEGGGRYEPCFYSGGKENKKWSRIVFLAKR